LSLENLYFQVVGQLRGVGQLAKLRRVDHPPFCAIANRAQVSNLPHTARLNHHVFSRKIPLAVRLLLK
jgi:hypothetical protein